MFTIVLDPGHVKGYNQGAVNDYKEGTKMYYLSQYLKEELENYNANVIITRNSITDNPSIDGRGKMAGTNNATVFISLHSNAVATYNNNVFGTVLYRSVHRPESKELADLLGNAIVELMKKDVPETYYRGVITRLYGTNDYYGVIRNSVVYDCVKYSYIIEHGFHTNIKECTWLNNDNNLKKLAKAEAGVLANYFKLSKKQTTTINTNNISETTNTTTTSTTKNNDIQYTIAKNDTLWNIAIKYLGSGVRYKEIISLNNDKYGMHITSMNLKVGDKIYLPIDTFRVKVSTIKKIYKDPVSKSIISNINPGIYNISELSSNYGKLLSGAGWVNIDDVTKI